jgi:hypothetical protein
LGLFRKPILINIAQKTTPMLFHPNTWIRFGTPPSLCLPAMARTHTWSLVSGRCAGVVALTEAISKQLSRADVFCFLFPILRPFLQCDIVHVTESNLLQALQSPVPSPASPLLSSTVVRVLCVCVVCVCVMRLIYDFPGDWQVSRGNFEKALYSIGPILSEEDGSSPEPSRQPSSEDAADGPEGKLPRASSQSNLPDGMPLSQPLLAERPLHARALCGWT